MPPKFALQPLLDYRSHRVELLELEVARLIRQRLDLQAALDSLRDAQARLFMDLRTRLAGRLDLGAIDQVRVNLRAVAEQTTSLKASMAELEVEIIARNQELVQARQDAKVLENLKQKELERFQAEEARRENAQRDDLYIARAYRLGNVSVE